MNKVTAAECGDYESENLTRAIDYIISQYGELFASIRNKSKIVIKPNLLMAKNKYDFLALTSPKLLEAFINALKKFAKPENITIADSPGGPYMPSYMKMIYKYTGYDETAQRTGVNLNFDFTSKQMTKVFNGERKTFNIITPIYESDFIINLNRLKTHALALMSAGVKNMFGIIPGVEKVEMHSRYPTREKFSEMLVDLCAMCPPSFSLTDTVIAMEGNGPSGGTPRKVGLLLASDNVFALDKINAKIMGIEKDLPTVKYSEAQGYCGKEQEIEVNGENGLKIEDYIIKDLILPDSSGMTSMTASPIIKGLMDTFFSTKPFITDKCLKCKVCMENCPQKVIKQNESNKKIKITDYNKCIRCYCCSELCPHDAITVKKSFLVRLLNK